LKPSGVIHLQENIGGEILEGPGDKYLGDLGGAREKSPKSGREKNPDHWIWKGHVVEIHGIWRKSPLEESIVHKAKTPEAEALRVIDLRK
jgi:hypothetical protein